MRKHTPGPWRVFKDDKDGAVEVMAGPECIAYIYREYRANAQLIAAAPELLAQLKNICNHLHEYDLTEVIRLIKKAEGV